MRAVMRTERDKPYLEPCILYLYVLLLYGQQMFLITIVSLVCITLVKSLRGESEQSLFG